MVNTSHNTNSDRDIVITKLSKSDQHPLLFISKKESYYDPLGYVLMHIHHERGWQYQTIPKTNLRPISNNEFEELDTIQEIPFTQVDHLDNFNKQPTDNNTQFRKINQKYVSVMNFYSYKIQDRKYSTIPLFGRLFHQYIVDMYAKIEMGRLNYIKFNQSNLRADLYKGATDALDKNQDCRADSIGKKFILPSSFTGSPRYMNQLYQDAMSIIRKYGKSDLFITFTCNPEWIEIKRELKPFQKPNDRPDLIARVFNLKMKEITNDLFKKQIFGKCLAHLYVIEFQKRGLPHAHILIVLANEDKIQLNDIDLIVSAEIPIK